MTHPKTPEPLLGLYNVISCYPDYFHNIVTSFLLCLRKPVLPLTHTKTLGFEKSKQVGQWVSKG